MKWDFVAQPERMERRKPKWGQLFSRAAAADLRMTCVKLRTKPPAKGDALSGIQL